MSYQVAVIADSVAPLGARLTTFQLRYPRMIHAEFMTHRAISRNASSTRAIPIAKQIESVQDDPATPIYWGRNQQGMQAGDELDPDEIRQASNIWRDAKDDAIMAAIRLVGKGLHKQIAGRILEPFAHISVVATATWPGWANFFALRCHKDAMPEMRHLAVLMARGYQASTPIARWMYGDADDPRGPYHLPFISDADRLSIPACDLQAASVARCARVSYLRHDGTPAPILEDVALHDRLRDSGHWSPFEHVATPGRENQRSGNLIGWRQYRQMLPVSVHAVFDFSTLDQFDAREAVRR